MTLNLSSFQYEAISNLFQENHWDLEESRATGANPDNYAANANNMDTDMHTDEMDYCIPYVEGHEVCPFCFCCPCITNEGNRQFWWENQNQPPHARNSEKRKKIYKKFWTMMFHRDAWNSPMYQAKKQRALGVDPNRRRYVYIYHRRDIMPDCVIKLVREWLPNPPSLAYMGHLWE